MWRVEHRSTRDKNETKKMKTKSCKGRHSGFEIRPITKKQKNTFRAKLRFLDSEKRLDVRDASCDTDNCVQQRAPTDRATRKKVAFFDFCSFVYNMYSHMKFTVDRMRLRSHTHTHTRSAQSTSLVVAYILSESNGGTTRACRSPWPAPARRYRFGIQIIIIITIITVHRTSMRKL